MTKYYKIISKKNSVDCFYKLLNKKMYYYYEGEWFPSNLIDNKSFLEFYNPKPDNYEKIIELTEEELFAELL